MEQSRYVRWFDEHLSEDFVNSNSDCSFVDRAGFLAQIARPCPVKSLAAEDVLIRIMQLGFESGNIDVGFMRDFFDRLPPGSIDPGPPPRPAHPIYLPPVEHPSHPIVIPPGSISPGPPLVPSHPIYIPVYPAHPIVIPPIDPPTDGGEREKLIEWKAVWTPDTGWVVVGLPQFPHAAPSKK